MSWDPMHIKCSNCLDEIFSSYPGEFVSCRRFSFSSQSTGIYIDQTEYYVRIGGDGVLEMNDKGEWVSGNDKPPVKHIPDMVEDVTEEYFPMDTVNVESPQKVFLVMLDYSGSEVYLFYYRENAVDFALDRLCSFSNYNVDPSEFTEGEDYIITELEIDKELGPARRNGD